jgi:hypothetical protein
MPRPAGAYGPQDDKGTNTMSTNLDPPLRRALAVAAAAGACLLAGLGPRVRLTRDIGQVTMDFDGIERLGVRTLGGVDQITVNDLTGTELKDVGVNLASFDGTGDATSDTVTVNCTARADKVAVTRSGSQVLTTGLAAQTTIDGSEPSIDLLRVNTLGGRDTVTVSPDVTDLITPVVDLGADQ